MPLLLICVCEFVFERYQNISSTITLTHHLAYWYIVPSGCVCAVFLAETPVCSTTAVREGVLVHGQLIKPADQPLRDV